MTPLEPRAQRLLKTLVERYIAEGQPIGSRTLSRFSGLDVSPATIRNVMADLEEMGLITSPHTSAGRIPTTLGYRMFVDTLLTVEPLTHQHLNEIQDQFSPGQPQKLINCASQILSELTHFAGIVVAQRPELLRIKQIEFISLSENRILLIIVSTTGEVQNRILFTRTQHSQSDLATAAALLNEHFSGLSFEEINLKLGTELERLQTHMSDLMKATIEAGNAAAEYAKTAYVVSGEINLMDSIDLTTNMQQLKELFRLFEQRTSLMQLLDISRHADGVHIFIGGESGLQPLGDCSVVSAPYEVNGVVIGSLGVIGPTRMAYDKVIPIVDVTARLLSSALTAATHA